MSDKNDKTPTKKTKKPQVRRLTVGQQTYANEMADTSDDRARTSVECWRRAFPNNKANAATARVEASRMRSLPHVAQEIARQEAAQEEMRRRASRGTLAQIQMKTWQIADDTVGSSTTERLAALRLLRDMVPKNVIDALPVPLENVNSKEAILARLQELLTPVIQEHQVVGEVVNEVDDEDYDDLTSRDEAERDPARFDIDDDTDGEVIEITALSSDDDEDPQY